MWAVQTNYQIHSRIPSLYYRLGCRYYQVHNWVRFVLFGVGAALFLSVGNIILIVSFRRSFARRRALLSQQKHWEERRLKVGVRWHEFQPELEISSCFGGRRALKPTVIWLVFEEKLNRLSRDRTLKKIETQCRAEPINGNIYIKG